MEYETPQTQATAAEEARGNFEENIALDSGKLYERFEDALKQLYRSW
jgi:hypothetical protein